jgi:hypothetical protein
MEEWRRVTTFWPPTRPPRLTALIPHARRGMRLQVFVGRGWFDLVHECHTAASSASPDNELLAVKQKSAKGVGAGTWARLQADRVDLCDVATTRFPRRGAPGGRTLIRYERVSQRSGWDVSRVRISGMSSNDPRRRMARTLSTGPTETAEIWPHPRPTATPRASRWVTKLPAVMGPSWLARQ